MVQKQVATLAVAATLLLAATVYTTSSISHATTLLGANNIYAETGMAVPPPAKPMVHHHHPGMKAKAQTAEQYEHNLGKDTHGNPLPNAIKKAPMHKSMWERMEDAYFHPAAGIKLTEKVRTKIFAHESAKPAFKSKKGYKHWTKWENGYFQPLGKGAAVSDKDRLAKYGLEGGSLKPAKKLNFRAKKAAKWQKWEDAEFGHSQAQVAAVRLPLAPKKVKKARHFRLGGDTERGNKEASHQDLINSIVAKSWVNTAEVDGARAPPKPIRFVDTIA